MRRRGVDYTAYPPITGRRKSATAMLTEKNEKIIITNDDDNSLNKNGVNKKVFLDRKKTVCRILMVFHFSSSCVINSGYKFLT